MGGDHGGHGHGGHAPARPYEVPDWRSFKVEDVPQLVEVQKKLAAKGLKDPWLRNEVWRFHPKFGTMWSRARIALFTGFGVGLVAFGISVAGEIAYHSMYPPKDHHGHGHGQQDGHDHGHH